VSSVAARVQVETPLTSDDLLIVRAMVQQHQLMASSTMACALLRNESGDDMKATHSSSGSGNGSGSGSGNEEETTILSLVAMCLQEQGTGTGTKSSSTGTNPVAGDGAIPSWLVSLETSAKEWLRRRHHEAPPLPQQNQNNNGAGGHSSSWWGKGTSYSYGKKTTAPTQQQLLERRVSSMRGALSDVQLFLAMPCLSHRPRYGIDSTV
jgi:hypothetical protein